MNANSENSIQTKTSKTELLTIFLHGSKSNWNRADDLQPATCAATTYSGGNKSTHAVRCLGFTATAFDTDMGALVLAAHLAQTT
jgi:hypothetical protein